MKNYQTMISHGEHMCLIHDVFKTNTQRPWDIPTHKHVQCDCATSKINPIHMFLETGYVVQELVNH